MIAIFSFLKSSILYFLSSVLLFLFSFVMFEHFYMLFLPRIKEIQYVNYSLNGSFINTLIFSLLISLLPIFLLVIWKKAPIENVKQRIKSIFIFTVLILSFIVITYFLYKFYLMSLVEKLDGIVNTLDINSNILNKSILLAEILSSILIYLIFRKR